jgi:threonine dehydratase
MSHATSGTHPEVTLADIERLRHVVDQVARHTPIVESRTLGDPTSAHVFLKAENLQRTGSFKIRGATAKIASLGDAATHGVVAGSAGNHAQALALAARERGIPCEIHVPVGAAITKVEACRGYGAHVVEAGSSLSEAVAVARARAAETGMTFCHPYDDPVVVAGQGTAGLEILDDLPDVDTVVVPLGGGGLAAGIAIAVKSRRPTVRVIGVQAAACAPYAGGVVPDGAIETLADGIAVKQPGVVTAPLIAAWLDEVVTVDEDAVADAMVLLMERAKLYVEGAGAVGVAAVLAGATTVPRGTSACVVLSGGNVDLGVVPGLVRRHETRAGRRLILDVRITDRPGGLARLLATFADAGANVVEVVHVREGISLHVRETGVVATLEVRGVEHAASVVAAVREAGYRFHVPTW